MLICVRGNFIIDVNEIQAIILEDKIGDKKNIHFFLKNRVKPIIFKNYKNGDLSDSLSEILNPLKK
jgi:hypothetical protein